VCQGKRYNREVLQVRFKEHNIADILDMSVDEALALFESFPHIKAKLQTLHDVGLGYIKLGQPATTLSGGEAQRVKLATELSRRPTGKTLYILDEPTTGLSFEDISFLIKVLQRLVDQGNTVIVIEHHLDVVKNADFIIDLGPGAGDKGGWIVAQGTPEEIACNASSLTGSYLTSVLRGGREPVKSRTATL
jgi:excinuclease ABC subunit A